MALNEWPLQRVSSLTVGDVPVIPAVTSGECGYRLMGGVVGPIIVNYYFPRGPDNVAATYRAGYPSVPSDLEQVCIELVGLKLKERDRIGQSGKSIGQEHTSFITGPMTASMKDYLRNYKRNVPRWS